MAPVAACYLRQNTVEFPNPLREGGWPGLKSGPVLPDSDHDGMPDDWEVRHGLNPRDPSDAAADPDHDGYTNVEEYLNGTDPAGYVDYRDPKNNVNTLGGPAAP